MRRSGNLLSVLVGWLVASGPLGAGVYNTTESPFLPPVDKIDYFVSELRGIPAPANVPVRPGTLRYVYLNQLADLEARAREGPLTTPDRVNLGACYIRLQRDADAIRVLQAGDLKHFLILANLATAYQGMGQLDRAIAYQNQALQAWPTVWAGWSRTELIWYRRAERYYLKLLQLRQREQPDARGGPVRVQAVDPLFVERDGTKFRLEGQNGYEAGILPYETQAELPPDAFQIALQLVLWQPFDDRLYWLLGEVLNGYGQIEAAAKILDNLVAQRQRSDIRALMQHRKVLLAARAFLEKWADPKVRAALFAVVTPRGTLLPPVVGDVSHESAALAPFFVQQVPAPEPSQPTLAAASRWALDWRQLCVGFGSGILVAVFGGFQWQEWRRRRALARASTRPDPAEGPLSNDSHEGPTKEGVFSPSGE
jgi:hypothetical protein